MATLTRTRPSFQVEDDIQADVDARRPLHLDIPTPFPRVAYSTARMHEELPDGVSLRVEMEGSAVGDVDASAVAGSSREQEAGEASADSVSDLSVLRFMRRRTSGMLCGTWDTSRGMLSSLCRRCNSHEVQKMIASVS